MSKIWRRSRFLSDGVPQAPSNNDAHNRLMPRIIEIQEFQTHSQKKDWPWRDGL
jgi:hypothetical protein